MKFISKDNKGKVVDEIAASDIRMRIVSAGKNHSLCVEDWEPENSQNRVFSWGTGGYGRLGHNSADDELFPREVVFFSPLVVQGVIKSNPQRQLRQLVSGSTFTLAISVSKQLYFWGKLSNSSRGEATMYPKLVDDLYNWKSAAVSAGSNLVVVSADEKLVGWGAPVAGLIGFDGGAKATVMPKLITGLDGSKVHDISCGYGHVCFVVDPSTEAARASLAGLTRLVNTHATSGGTKRGLDSKDVASSKKKSKVK
jgi:hypothetical protein